MINPNNYKLGYYRVGDTIHSSKIRALIDGTNRNISPEWIFNNDVFNRVDWTIEPAESIGELYRQRAQRIRDKYDYVILMYSGGSDSHTILQTCLKHNIKIDELLVTWATSLSGTYKPDPNNVDISNGLSEWDYTIKPNLDWLAKNHPEIKISINDWADGVLDFKVEEDYILDRSNNYAPYAPNRWFFTELPLVKAQLEKRDSVGIIIGNDKPRICFHEGAYRLYFLDIVASNAGAQISSKFVKDDLHTELFYWSPDSTQIIAKQAHMIVRFFESVPGLKQYITWPISKLSNRQFYESAIRAVIYPDWNLNTFQVNKPTDVNSGYDLWLYNIGLEGKIKGIQKNNFDYLKTVIDKKYLNESAGVTSIQGMITGMWPVKIITP